MKKVLGGRIRQRARQRALKEALQRLRQEKAKEKQKVWFIPGGQGGEGLGGEDDGRGKLPSPTSPLNSVTYQFPLVATLSG